MLPPLLLLLLHALIALVSIRMPTPYLCRARRIANGSSQRARARIRPRPRITTCATHYRRRWHHISNVSLQLVVLVCAPKPHACATEDLLL